VILCIPERTRRNRLSPVLNSRNSITETLGNEPVEPFDQDWHVQANDLTVAHHGSPIDQDAISAGDMTEH
jgi:hypothetical protein